MEGICVGKGIVVELKFIFGLFGYKTQCSCVYHKTAEKQQSFSTFIVLDSTRKLMR